MKSPADFRFSVACNAAADRSDSIELTLKPGLPGAKVRRQILTTVLAACSSLAIHGDLHASEQSLSCNGALLARGDTVESLLQKCGEPVSFQAVCVSLLQIETRPIRSDAERSVLARNCVRMDEWLYDRGPGTFSAIVRLQNRLIESVRDGQFRP